MDDSREIPPKPANLAQIGKSGPGPGPDLKSGSDLARSLDSRAAIIARADVRQHRIVLSVGSLRPTYLSRSFSAAMQVAMMALNLASQITESTSNNKSSTYAYSSCNPMAASLLTTYSVLA
jgi:hypothetical protein